MLLNLSFVLHYKRRKVKLRIPTRVQLCMHAEIQPKHQCNTRDSNYEWKVKESTLIK